MAESTQPGTPATTPTSWGWCAWHQSYARGVRLIRAIEQGSGPGASLFACGPCRKTHNLTPLADLPL
ncbi:hypothetical protein GA0115233_103024 [Streptomyces sp. DI166]|uniref:hypothetical protein n=1 Tax=unclassified Streptomyces TaxID=2593676 RepID=UPI0007F44CFC|nr:MULTISPECIES: hypothetical protein [unclassified Streptomyces]SBT91392.1 hypothetical protein GA0115233_103024 [Streptomyces sp. DI166]